MRAREKKRVFVPTATQPLGKEGEDRVTLEQLPGGSEGRLLLAWQEQEEEGQQDIPGQAGKRPRSRGDHRELVEKGGQLCSPFPRLRKPQSSFLLGCSAAIRTALKVGPAMVNGRTHPRL